MKLLQQIKQKDKKDKMWSFPLYLHPNLTLSQVRKKIVDGIYKQHGNNNQIYTTISALYQFIHKTRQKNITIVPEIC